MKNSLLQKIIFSILFIAGINNSFAQSAILSQDAKVSVLTCGTGNESYSLFGHTAIRITDAPNFIDLVYNYGAFDFNTPNFVAKFTKGDLQYFAVTHPFNDFMNEYQYERRAVYEQELNISLDKKQQLFDNLNQSVASGDSHYTYKFIDKNCTSMVVDIINKTLGTQAIVKKTDTDITYRSILYPYFDNHFYEKLGTSIIFGKKVDELGTHIFLPFELLKSLKMVQFQGQPLAKESTILLATNDIPENSLWNNIYSYILFLLLIVSINKKAVRQFYFVTMGILGLFFIFIGFYSSHHELAYNYNALLFNPSLLILAFYYWKKNSKMMRNLVYFNIASLIVYLVIVANKAHLLIVLPLIATSAFLLIKIILRIQKNKMHTNKIRA